MADVHQIEIVALSYGAHGVGRLDGKTIFVRAVAPGETVEVTIREDHGRYAYADLIRIVAPSPQRRLPPCPYLPRCGGCPWQHLEDESQRRAKERNLRDALERIARWRDPPVAPLLPASAPLHYRSRLSLRVAGRALGFYAAASHDLVPIEHCLLSLPAVDAAMPAVRDFVERAPGEIRRVEILACERHGDIVISGEIEGSLPPAIGRFVEAWLADQPGCAGVALHGRRWRRAWGRASVVIRPEPDLDLVASAGAFTQVNPDANRHLVRRVLELGEFTPEERVLDLYAGIGNLTLPIARRVAEVVAVEQNPLASTDARGNARAAGIANVDVRTSSTKRGLDALLDAAEPFDVVVLDPPRSGAAEAIDPILRLAPSRLLYVSCNPATLARDLKRLRSAYTFDTVEPIDLFPQTYHMEAIARGRRRR